MDWSDKVENMSQIIYYFIVRSLAENVSVFGSPPGFTERYSEELEGQHHVQVGLRRLQGKVSEWTRTVLFAPPCTILATTKYWAEQKSGP